MGIPRRAFAWALPRVTRGYDRWAAPHRRKLLSSLNGEVLEIGAGAGANAPFYPEGCRLTLLEPNPHFGDALRSAYGDDVRVQIEDAEEMSFPDDSFDAIVSTLVLCSVGDVDAVLSEVRRVLRPRGRLVFVEHVAGEPGSRQLRVQKAVAPVWSWCADGCHTHRETISALERHFERVEFERIDAPFPVVSPHVIGTASG